MRRLGFSSSALPLATLSFVTTSMAHAAADALPQGSLVVTVIPCAADATTPPEISLDGDPLPRQPEYTGILTRRSVPLSGQTGIFEGSFQLNPGFFAISAKGARCGTHRLTLASVYPALERRVVLVTVPGSFYRLTDFGPASVAVRAPGGLRLDMISTSNRGWGKRTGMRDGDVTYFDGLFAGNKYFLEVWAGFTVACIPVEIPKTMRGFEKYYDLNLIDIAPMLRDAAVRSSRGCITAPSARRK